MACQKARRSSDPCALGDDVLGELFDVEVQRDEVVDLLHLARQASLALDLIVSLTASHDLTPGLGGQGVVFRRGGVPASALGYVTDARGDVFGQVEGRFKAFGGFRLPGVPSDAVADGGVDVAVWVVPQQAATRRHQARRPRGTPS